MASNNKESERKVYINEGDNSKCKSIIDKEDEETNEETNSNNINCSNCSKEPAHYMNYPCGCNVYCKKCAMKLATGGKCKKCNSIFSSMKSLISKIP